MIEINLLPKELKAQMKKGGSEAALFLFFIPLVFGIFLCVHIYFGLVGLAKNYQFHILNNRWQSLEPQRKTLESSKQEYSGLSQEARAIALLTKQGVNWSEKLNRLSLNLPSGVWLNELSVNLKTLTLKGSVVSLQKEEFNLINKFINNLKKDVVFFSDFNNLELSSVQRRVIAGYDVVDFILLGTLKSK